MRTFICFLLFLIHLGCYGQEIKYTQQAADSFKIKPLNEENLEKFKQILKSDEQLFGWTKYYAYLGYRKAVIKEHDSAKWYAKKAIDVFQNLYQKHPNEEKCLVQAYYALGFIARLEERFEASTTHMLSALKIAEDYEVPLKSYITNTIANNKLSLGNYENALVYYKRNLQDSLFIKSPQAEITNLTKVGILYLEGYLNQPDSAKFYLKKALTRSLNTEYKNNVPYIYANLADYFRGKNEDSTLFYYRESKVAFEDFVVDKNSSPDNTDLYQITNNSYVAIFENQIPRAIKDLNFVVDSLRNNIHDRNDRDILRTAYDNLVLAYEKSDNFKAATVLLKERQVFEIEFQQLQLTQQLEKLELEFETKKKEEEILSLKKEAETTATILQQQRIIGYSAIGGGLLLLGIGWLIYKQKRLNEKFKLVSLEQRLLRSQMNPHFLFNALTTAALLIDEKAEKAKGYIVKLAKLLRLTLENSREDFVSLDSEIEAFTSYLQLQSDFSEKFDYDITIDSNLETEYIAIPPMLIQPFLENAVLHGIGNSKNRGDIKISIKKATSDTVVCTITDNGIGLAPKMNSNTGNHESLSLKIVQERLALYHKSNETLVSLQNLKEVDPNLNGTQIMFSIPFDTL